MDLHSQSKASQAIVPDSAGQQADSLVRWFDAAEYAVALSGGVDSAVVCQAAVLSGCDVLALTAQSPALAEREAEDALQIVAQTGVKHRFVHTQEITDGAYVQNDPQRCYHCKGHLFSLMRSICPDAILVSGTNADDLGDYRPGLRAATEAQVRAPLAELGFGKSVVRDLASWWGLKVADKPASPCLASRLAYGVSVTPERLRQVEQAEAWLRDAGLRDCRVRYHSDELARIEVAVQHIGDIASDPMREQLLEYFKQIGFRYVTLDLAGFQSGSLNQVVALSTLSKK